MLKEYKGFYYNDLKVLAKLENVNLFGSDLVKNICLEIDEDIEEDVTPEYIDKNYSSYINQISDLYDFYNEIGTISFIYPLALIIEFINGKYYKFDACEEGGDIYEIDINSENWDR